MSSSKPKGKIRVDPDRARRYRARTTPDNYRAVYELGSVSDEDLENELKRWADRVRLKHFRRHNPQLFVRRLDARYVVHNHGDLALDGPVVIVQGHTEFYKAPWPVQAKRINLSPQRTFAWGARVKE